MPNYPRWRLRLRWCDLPSEGQLNAGWTDQQWAEIDVVFREGTGKSSATKEELQVRSLYKFMNSCSPALIRTQANAKCTCAAAGALAKAYTVEMASLQPGWH